MSQGIHLSTCRAGLHNHILGLSLKRLSDRLEQLARDNAAIFEENGVIRGDSRREESVPLH